jgi:hypothetical protein
VDDATQIDVEHAPEALEILFFERAHQADPCSVDHDIDRSKPNVYRVRQTLHLCEVGDVSLQANHGSTALRELSAQSLEACTIRVAQRQACASLRKFHGARAANAAGRPGDQYDISRKIAVSHHRMALLRPSGSPAPLLEQAVRNPTRADLWIDNPVFLEKSNQPPRAIDAQLSPLLTRACTQP